MYNVYSYHVNSGSCLERLKPRDDILYMYTLSRDAELRDARREVQSGNA